MLPGHKYKLEDILGILWRRKWLIVLPLVFCATATYMIAKRLPNLYKSETLILVVPQRVPESYVRSTISGRITDRLQSLKEQILSRSRLERIILDFNLFQAERQTHPLETVIEIMRDSITVETVRGGEAFSVTYVARDPVTAKNVAERLAAVFIEENVHEREMLAVGTSDFLQTQLDDARARLIAQEHRLAEYRSAYAGQLPSQVPFNSQALQNLRIQLQTLENAAARARERQLLLERQTADLIEVDPPAPAAPVSATDSQEPVGATPRERLEDGRRKLALLEPRLKPAHPDVVRLKRRLAQLEREAAETVVAPPPTDLALASRQRRASELRADLESIKREIAGNQTQQRKVQDEINAYQARLDAAPLREAELTELSRDYETMQQIYRALLAKREDSKVAANLEQRQVGEQFRVLDPARVPETPFKPDRLRINLVGIALGLALGLGATGLLEYLDTTLKTEDDVRMLLALPVIATVPELIGATDESPAWTTRVFAGLRG